MSESACCRLRLEITGVVQGVGFRPAVARLATDRGVSGFVYNDAGQRLQPWLVSGAWPPNPATGIGQDGQPVSPATHYLVRNS